MNNKTQIISILNNKGGVLKTTTLINISIIIAKLGKKILIIDADGQANTTASFDIFNEKYNEKFEDNQKHVDFIKTTLIDLLNIDLNEMDSKKILEKINSSIFTNVFNSNEHEIKHIKFQIKQLNSKINFIKRNKKMNNESIDKNINPFSNEISILNKKINKLEELKNNSGYIDLIPANYRLKTFERKLYLEMAKDNKLIPNQHLKSIIQFLTSSYDYDYILIDSPPSLGLISENIMASSTKLIIPMQLEQYSIQGLDNIISTFYELKEMYPQIEIGAILPTLINSRLKSHKENYEALSNYLKQNEPKFYNKLVRFEDGIRQSGRSTTELMKNNILVETDWYKPDLKKHQNTLAYLTLTKDYII